MSSVPAASDAIMEFPDVQALAAPGMARVNALIRSRLASDVVLINQIAEHIIGGGGKRLRPMLVLLAAQAAGYRGTHEALLAAIVEFIHTATLLHDDVVDESDLRRGRKTANALWGNAASVLVGDFLYSRSFQLMVEADDMRVMRILADTTNRIAEGEVLQLLNVHNPDVDEAAYLRVIERKTAVLFSAATQLGALLAGVSRCAGTGVCGLRDESRVCVPDRRRCARLCVGCGNARQEHRRRSRRRQGDVAADLCDRARACGTGGVVAAGDRIRGIGFARQYRCGDS